MFGIYSSMSISGGHLNPAVSLTMATFGRLGRTRKENWTKFLVYAIAQFVGKSTVVHTNVHKKYVLAIAYSRSIYEFDCA